MKPVGIIANPASGKDIRRLVAFGSVFDNNEKVNIVRRVVLGLDAVGVQEVFFMPDFFGIGIRAIEDLDVSLKVSFLEMKMEGSHHDSTLAAKILNELGVACIITLGGDGTNRAVAKTCKDIPLLPISTGTNNVFPFMIESTLVGIAGGVTARNSGSQESLVKRAPVLEMRRGSDLMDLALIDVVLSKVGFIASRALWDVSTLREIFLARARPGNIGFSSIGGLLCELPDHAGQGVHIIIGKGRQRVKAPIAPGLVRWIPIKSYRFFEPGEVIPVSQTPAMIALDGERELIAREGDQFTITLNPKGPRVVDIAQTLQWASQECLFLEKQPHLERRRDHGPAEGKASRNVQNNGDHPGI